MAVLMIVFVSLYVMDAQPINVQQALQVAKDFFPNKDFLVKPIRKAYGTNSSLKSFYIFNAEDNAGFVIVSGDERMEPVLGYSYTGNISSDTLPDNVNCWLTFYSKTFENIQERKHSTHVRRATNTEGRKTVKPLLKTQWGQGKPYNDQCPLIGEERCVTGCVATAVAQLMKYYQYPGSTKATFQYRTKTNKLSIKALPAVDFDWKHMLNSYSPDATQTERNAVSTLMLYCGCVLSMDYDTSGSGADATPVCDAMEYFFDYDEAITKVYRMNYEDTDWEDLIYKQLARKLPVFYSGRTTENEGHAFVIDGYDKGFFHINWGWGGFCDGYFRLSILYPYADDYDETNYVDGYTVEQMAVINIYPKDFQGFSQEIEISPMKELTEVIFEENITEDIDWANTVINNVYVTLDTKGGNGYDTEEKCIALTSIVTDEQLEFIADKEVGDDMVKENFNGLILEVPAGKGTISITAETKSDRALSVKIADAGTHTFVQPKRGEVKIPYISDTDTYVYVYGVNVSNNTTQGISDQETDGNVLIYSIKWKPSVPSYTLVYVIDGETYKTIEVEYGASITPEEEPEKEGCTFSGWSEIPTTMPAENVTVTGTFTTISKITIPGDVNGDGGVNVFDVTATVNYILGSRNECFDEDAADANDDGTVNVFDVTKMVNIILGVDAGAKKREE
ncbi:MAG: C10 family peptidase [Bacteroidaceae bacterium]|nr:C10 family peptidase [Bacteroidaceae bacterium]